MNKRVLLSAFALLASFSRIEAQQPQLVVKSPQGDLTMTLAIRSAKGEEAQSGQLVYSVRYRDKLVLEESTLGLDLEGGALLGAKVHVTAANPARVLTITAWRPAKRATYMTRTKASRSM